MQIFLLEKPDTVDLQVQDEGSKLLETCKHGLTTLLRLCARLFGLLVERHCRHTVQELSLLSARYALRQQQPTGQHMCMPCTQTVWHAARAMPHAAAAVLSAARPSPHHCHVCTSSREGCFQAPGRHGWAPCSCLQYGKTTLSVGIHLCRAHLLIKSHLLHCTPAPLCPRTTAAKLHCSTAPTCAELVENQHLEAGLRPAFDEEQGALYVLALLQ